MVIFVASISHGILNGSFRHRDGKDRQGDCRNSRQPKKRHDVAEMIDNLARDKTAHSRTDAVARSNGTQR